MYCTEVGTSKPPRISMGRHPLNQEPCAQTSIVPMDMDVHQGSEPEPNAFTTSGLLPH